MGHGMVISDFPLQLVEVTGPDLVTLAKSMKLMAQFQKNCRCLNRTLQESTYIRIKSNIMSLILKCIEERSFLSLSKP